MTVATVAVLFLSTAANNWNFVAEWGRLDLLEVCVPSDSMLSRVCVEKGGDVLSLGLLNGYNLATKQGYDRACAEIFDKRPRHTAYVDIRSLYGLLQLAIAEPIQPIPRQAAELRADV